MQTLALALRSGTGTAAKYLEMPLLVLLLVCKLWHWHLDQALALLQNIWRCHFWCCCWYANSGAVLESKW
jgi:hypothetical protein